MVVKGRYSPLDPAALGTTFAAPGEGAGIKSAVVGDNADLISDVSRLWVSADDVIVDVTYGRGAFWRKACRAPDYCFDLQTGQDLRAVPLEDNSVDVVVLDPPYRPSHGSKNFGGNGLAQAYKLGEIHIDTIEDVLDLYRKGIKEASRICRLGGRILVKCQDLSYGHRLHLVSLDVLNIMVNNGFELADHFVLVNKSQLVSPVWTRQERARRNHSVLWVGVNSG